MKLLIIPTWFPHRCFPLEGSYALDQALALGDLRPSWRLGLSLWNQGEAYLSPAHALRSPRCMLDALLSRRAEVRELSSNVLSFKQPCPSWTPRIAHGNREGILRANRLNFQRASQHLDGIDLIHAHVSFPGGWVAMRLAAETGVPYVLTEHMGPFPLPTYRTRDGALADFIREPLERARARIAVSPSLAERIAGFGIPRPLVVPNAVDERCYRPNGTSDPHRFVFFTLCGMERAKGIHDLLEAIALLLPQLPEPERQRVRFRLGGEGPALREFQAHGRRLGLDDWVSWLGLLSRDQARDEYQSCDAFVLPSHHESFGIVFVEAAACGKPVIATRSGGPETIVTEDTGLLVDVGNTAQLAEALRVLLRRERRFDPDRIRQAFLERFSRPAVVDRLEATYRDALGSSSTARSAGVG